jgi:sigma-B regulation protein RsbU (phosphoserine phosphatase)
MLGLRDFFHLPQVDELVEQIVHEKSGLMVVAGLDARPVPAEAVHGGFLPSGRTTIFRILVDEFLLADPSMHGIVVTEDKDGFRITRKLGRRLLVWPVQPPQTHAKRLTEAIGRRPNLLVIDRMTPETMPAALEAASKGLLVLSQLDSVFHGAGVARHLSGLGATRDQLENLTWVITVQRIAKLCQYCKQPSQPDPIQLEELVARYPEIKSGPFYQARGCSKCDHTGRYGDVAVFDIFRADPKSADYFAQTSRLSIETYMLQLASSGQLPLEDIQQFDQDQLQRTFNMLVTREKALMDSNNELERKLIELEAANRVLEQRTQALFSLQDIGQILISSSDLRELAGRICRRARDLCGADRAILYYLHSVERAELLAVSGWDLERVPARLNAGAEFSASILASNEPKAYNRWPPGIPPRHPDVEGARLRAGLLVPLAAQDKLVGVMIVHTTLKADFTPGEVALLQAFANQAALAIQRAGLVDELRNQIVQLEAAQVELAKKERMEREMELAHEVQQSVLPHTFPQIAGFQFAAQNIPARHVGGDFYDVIPLDEKHFGIAIADVSDKGMPAALYMALTRSLLLAEARRARSPRQVLTSVNQLLLEIGQQNMFVTAFYGVVNRDTRRLTYARAGHDQPFLVRQGTVRQLGGQGTLLGILDQNEFQVSEEQVNLSPGDRLVLYSDGLTDIMDSNQERFNRERFLSLVQSYANHAPDQMCAKIFADLMSYRGNAEQYDDMTLLVVQADE